MPFKRFPLNPYQVNCTQKQYLPMLKFIKFNLLEEATTTQFSKGHIMAKPQIFSHRCNRVLSLCHCSLHTIKASPPFKHGLVGTHNIHSYHTSLPLPPLSLSILGVCNLRHTNDCFDDTAFHYTLLKCVGCALYIANQFTHSKTTTQLSNQ